MSTRHPISGARFGDFALAAVWTIQGAATARHAWRLGASGDRLGAAHIAVVAVILFVSAGLFIARGPAVKRGGGFGAKAAAIAGTWSIIALTALPLTWRPDWLLTVVTLGLIAAYGVVLWGLLTLRRGLSIFPEARCLVRHGPYAFVRHPLYSAHIACYCLIALPRLSPWSLAVLALGVTGEAIRARNEERLLGAVFPDYAAYAASTPRFIPRLGRRTAFRARPMADSAERTPSIGGISLSESVEVHS